LKFYSFSIRSSTAHFVHAHGPGRIKALRTVRVLQEYTGHKAKNVFSKIKISHHTSVVVI